MENRIQDLRFDPTNLHGLSENLIRSHHQNNYGGAVKRLNAIRAQWASLSPASSPGFVLNGLKREELVACNSVLLHELYFGSLGGEGGKIPPTLELALEASFCSVERWREEFVAMGKALGGGSGWVLLTFLPSDGALVNQWASDHTQALAGGLPILALDMYEHSYHMDFGASAASYVDAFMENIRWESVGERFQKAVYGASEPYGATNQDLANALVLDVRRKAVFEKSTTQVAGARWMDPMQVASWARDLPTDRDIVVYCVHGHEVSRATALRLRAEGLKARYLVGGFDGWQAAGHAIESIGAQR